MKRHIPTALVVAGVATTAAAQFAFPAEAQFFTQQSRNQFSPYQMPDTTHLRVLAIAMSGAIGFGLGRFVSPWPNSSAFTLPLRSAA